MEVLGRLLAMLAVLLVGTGLRSSGVLNATRTARLNAAAYYVALPALVFVATYDQSIGDLLSAELFVGSLVVLFATGAIAWVTYRNRLSTDRQSVAIIQSYHSNLGYLGVPLVAATFDAQVTAIASVILGFVTLVQLPLTIVVLSAFGAAEAAIGRELQSLATNPVLLALAAGLAVGSVGVTFPGDVVVGLDALGSLALPLALLCVGAALQIDADAVDLEAVGSVVALKLCCMPLLAWAVFSLLAVDSATFTAGVVMLGMPTAVSTYVYANELGGDAEFASLNVFATTVASVASLFVLITLVG
ncbi:AEC family transporter [Natronococcus sp. A-GB1]|uniref:AEC family transporter n=1 Tax=Natronococcus sp. A-GB1 TaxID=3037648 RepID=UPI002420118F|nr:AEC family transporter [Natronococcus sp. A-GB1]MDG5760512.1 AEC family transporter [Natronococcus sp. A-GB1]